MSTFSLLASGLLRGLPSHQLLQVLEELLLGAEALAAGGVVGFQQQLHSKIVPAAWSIWNWETMADGGSSNES